MTRRAPVDVATQSALVAAQAELQNVLWRLDFLRLDSVLTARERRKIEGAHNLCVRAMFAVGDIESKIATEKP